MNYEELRDPLASSPRHLSILAHAHNLQSLFFSRVFSARALPPFWAPFFRAGLLLSKLARLDRER